MIRRSDSERSNQNFRRKRDVWSVIEGWKNLILNKDIFPTNLSLFIFIAYMALFVNQGLLVTASRNGEQTYPFNPTTVVLLTETIKLLLSSAVFLKDHSVTVMLDQIVTHARILVYYLIPAFLYCLYNNLSFTNLVIFDPTSYFMFMQIRLLMTGVIYQFLFKRRLSNRQWFSLLLITIGCMVQKMDLNSSLKVLANPEKFNSGHILTVGTGLVFILTQVCCSVFAGVYNEYLIKNIAGHDVDIMIQNVYMYIDSIACNLFVLGYKGELTAAFNHASLLSILQFYVLAIILNNAAVGIVTSLFLKNLNSILKAFASALELVLTAILSFFLLGFPIHWNTFVAVTIVAYAVVLYASNPLKSVIPVTSKTNTKSESGGESTNDVSKARMQNHV